MEPIEFKVNKMFDEDMQEIQIARHPQMQVVMPCGIELKENDIFRLKKFDISSYL